MTSQLPPPPPQGPPAAPPPPFAPPPASAPPGAGWGGAGGWAPSKPLGPAPGVTYASHGGRFLAYLIDVVILGVVTSLLFVLLFALGALTMASQSTAGFFALFALLPLLVLGLNAVQFGYFAIGWYRSGATLGMRAMNIRVVRSADGGPLTKQQAMLRAFGYWVSGAVLDLGFIWILIDDRHQGWHDKIADTLVIDAR